MTIIVHHTPGSWKFSSRLRRHRGLILAFVVFAFVFGGLNLALSTPLGYYDFASTINNSATLAVAGIGQTIVVIAGGLDLSAGAVISLTNCLIVAGINNALDPVVSVWWTLAGILVGCFAGAVNGFFIAYFRLQPIAVTLASPSYSRWVVLRLASVA
jgi:ribose transport system permease protein